MPTRKFKFREPSNPANCSGSETPSDRPAGVSSVHFLRLIEDRGNVGFWTSDFSTDIITVSPGIRRLLDLDDSAQPKYDDFISMIHPDDRPKHAGMREIIRSGQAISREFRLVRRDGTVRWVQNKAEVVLDAAFKPARAIGILIDVTDQYDARISVVEAWQRYNTLIAAIAPVQWRNLPNGEVTHRLGYEALVGDFVSRNETWLELIHPDDREATHSAWTDSLATGNMYATEFRVRCLDDKYRVFMARAAPIFNTDGSIREWQGVLIEHASGRSERPRQTNANVEIDDRHIRAARGFLNWTIQELSSASGVSVSTIRRMENKDHQRFVRSQHFKAVRLAFQQQGVSFCWESGAGLSIRLPLDG